MKTKNFDSFADDFPGRRAIPLLKEHAVKPHHIFAAVLEQVTGALPNLRVGVKYTAKKLCKPETWAAWTTAEVRVAGMCLAYMVKHQLVKLIPHVTRSGKGSRRYILPPSAHPTLVSALPEKESTCL